MSRGRRTIGRNYGGYTNVGRYSKSPQKVDQFSVICTRSLDAHAGESRSGKASLHSRPQPFFSSRRDRRVSMAARRKRKRREGLKKVGHRGGSRESIFEGKGRFPERASPVDSLLFCQTSDAPAP